jgi:hypothetical protein
MHLHLNQDYEFGITIKHSMKKGKKNNDLRRESYYVFRYRRQKKEISD